MDTNFKMENKYITMIKGDTLSIGIKCVDENNNPISNIKAVTMTCRDIETGKKIIFQKSIGDGVEKSSEDANIYIIRVAPSDTETTEAGKYIYDVEIRAGSDVFTVMKGYLQIDDDVTKPGIGGREYEYNLIAVDKSGEIELLNEELTSEIERATEEDKYASTVKTVINTYKYTIPGGSNSVNTDITLTKGKTYYVTESNGSIRPAFFISGHTETVIYPDKIEKEFVAPETGIVTLYKEGGGVTINLTIKTNEEEIVSVKEKVRELTEELTSEIERATEEDKYASTVKTVINTYKYTIPGGSNSVKTDITLTKGKTYYVTESNGSIRPAFFISGHAETVIYPDKIEKEFVAPETGIVTLYKEGGGVTINLTIKTNEKEIVSVKEKVRELTEENIYVGYGLNNPELNYYTSLVDALYKAQSINGKKTVHVKGGTYDILSELGGMSYIKSKNTTDDKWATVQPVNHDITIIGHGKVVLNFNLDNDTPSTNYFLFSALNFNGNCRVENIAINASNCRYCIHDESGAENTDAKHVYIGVTLNKSGNYYQAMGCGFSERCAAIFDRCNFVSDMVGELWSCHARDGANVSFSNCIFKSSRSDATANVRLSQNGSNISLTAGLYNCYLSHGIRLSSESGTATDVSRTVLRLINTTVTQILNGYSNEPTVEKYTTIR